MATAAEARRPEITAADLTALRRADPRLGPAIDRVGIPPDWWADRPWATTRLGVLVFEIVGQQISVAAATAMWNRLLTDVGGELSAAGLAALDEPARGGSDSATASTSTSPVSVSHCNPGNSTWGDSMTSTTTRPSHG